MEPRPVRVWPFFEKNFEKIEIRTLKVKIGKKVENSTFFEKITDREPRKFFADLRGLIENFIFVQSDFDENRAKIIKREGNYFRKFSKIFSGAHKKNFPGAGDDWGVGEIFRPEKAHFSANLKMRKILIQSKAF